MKKSYMAAEDSDTGIKIYLREIGQIPLLTPEQEIELAAKIKKGDREARALMIRSNLRLVVKIAHDYANLGLPLLDLISEGNIGLMKAVERFDPAKGGKLSTYAAWWIKQSIKRALANQSKTIRLPVHLVDKISKMRRVSLQMSEELGREPTDEELGSRSYVDLSAFQVVEGLRYAFPHAMERLAPRLPLLMALRDRMAERPRIAAYLRSERRIPFNEMGIFRHYPELDAKPRRRRRAR